MSIRESFEERGERRGIVIGERRGVAIGAIKTLLKLGYTDMEIIKYLTTEDDNPLTKEQAKEALENYHKENL